MTAPKSYKDPAWDKAEKEASAKTGVPAEVLAAIRLQGERSNADQVSPKGAKGVYQFMPATERLFAKKYGVSAYSTDPVEQATAAAYHLKESYARTKDWGLAAAGFNGGPAGEKNPRFTKETAGYYDRVVNALPVGLRGPQSSDIGADSGTAGAVRRGAPSYDDFMAGRTIEPSGPAAAGSPGKVVPAVAFRAREDDREVSAAIQEVNREQQTKQAQADAQRWITSGGLYDRGSTVGAFYSDTMAPLFKAYDRSNVQADPEYLAQVSADASVAFLGVDNPNADEQADLLSARSAEDRDAIRARLLTKRQDEEVMANASTLGGLAAGFVTGALDPFTYVSGVGAAKAFYAAGRGATLLAATGRRNAAIASLAGENAAGNVAYEAVRGLAGEHQTVADYALAGATGMLPALLGVRGLSRTAAEYHARVHEAVLAKQEPYLRRAAETLGEEADPAAVRKLAAELEHGDAMDAVAAVRTRGAQVVAPDPAAQAPDQAVLDEVNGDAGAPVVRESLDYEPVPTTGSGEVAAAMRELYNRGVLAELRSADDLPAASPFHAEYGDAVPADAKALYIPQDDKVYIFKDRLTPQERENPKGLIAHEIGVHYGLERTVGTETFTKIMNDLQTSNSPEVVAARSKVPHDTPDYLRGEELLGYLAEYNPNSSFVQTLVSRVRNWLRDNTRIFKNLSVTAQDALAYVRGAVSAARRTRLSADLTFPYVWHGGPTHGIDQLSTQFVGQGEGNAAFGWGTYLTSERGTALDYRNKESKRRGLAPSAGGLYQVRINATKSQLLDWDKPVSAEIAAKFPGTPTDSGQAFYNAIAEALGSQKAASLALADAGVPGLQYQTGRTRGKDTVNSNYVMFTDAGTDITARYSRSGVVNATDTRYGLTALSGDDPTTRMRRKAIRSLIEHAEAEMKANPIDKEKTKTIMKNSLFNMATPGLQLALSDHPVAQWASRYLVENTMGGSGRHVTAAIRKAQYELEFVGAGNNVMDQAFESWKARQGVGQFQGLSNDMFKGDLLDAFDRKVYAEIENRRWGKPTSRDPDVIRAADAQQVQYERMLQAQKLNKTVGWAILPDNSVGYIPHIFNAGKLGAMSNARRETMRIVIRDQMVDILGFDKEFADKLSGAYMNHARTNANGGHEIPANVLDPHAPEYIRQAAQAAGMTEAEILALGKKLSAGGATHTKKRLNLDLTKEYTDDEGTFMLMDMMNTDVRSLLKNQARRVAGEVGVTQQGVHGSAGLKLIEEALHYTENGKVDAEAVRAFQQVSAELLGRPYGDKMPTLAEGAMTVNAAASLGQMVVPQLVETFNMATILGLSSTMRGIASLPRMIGEVRKLARGEKLPDSLLASVEVPGGEFGMNDYRLVTRWDSPSAMYDTVGRDQLSTADKLIRAAGHNLGKLSFHRIVQAAQVRASAEQILQKSLKYIRDGVQDKALADMGITPELAARIKAELPNVAAFDGNGNTISLDMHKAGDREAVEQFISVLHRGNGQIIQRSFVGEIGPWQHSTMGKILTQFRTFPITAMEKQWGRQRGLHGAARAMGLVVAVAPFAVPIYLAKVALNATGRDDPDAYIDRMTTPLALAKGTMNYLGMLGLAPDVLDGVTATPVLGTAIKETLGSDDNKRPGTAGGLGSIVPIVGRADRTLQALQGEGGPKALAQTLPFSNLFYVTPFVNALPTDWD